MTDWSWDRGVLPVPLFTTGTMACSLRSAGREVQAGQETYDLSRLCEGGKRRAYPNDKRRQQRGTMMILLLNLNPTPQLTLWFAPTDHIVSFIRPRLERNFLLASTLLHNCCLPICYWSSMANPYTDKHMHTQTHGMFVRTSDPTLSAKAYLSMKAVAVGIAARSDAALATTPRGRRRL